MKRKILVVDDDEAILDAISILLDTYGYHVCATADGGEVNSKISQFHPDLILLDVLLTGFDGRVICKKLKSNPTTYPIPIIMISAHPGAKKHSLLSGANDFLAKPFDMEQLLDLIEKNLSV